MTTSSDYLLTAARSFGIVRLKLLLALQRHPELDEPGWSGRFIADVGPHGQVKAGIEPSKREVTLDQEEHA